MAEVNTIVKTADKAMLTKSTSKRVLFMEYGSISLFYMDLKLFAI